MLQHENRAVVDKAWTPPASFRGELSEGRRTQMTDASNRCGIWGQIARDFLARAASARKEYDPIVTKEFILGQTVAFYLGENRMLGGAQYDHRLGPIMRRTTHNSYAQGYCRTRASQSPYTSLCIVSQVPKKD